MFIESLIIFLTILGLFDLYILLKMAEGLGIMLVIISQFSSFGAAVWFLRKIDRNILFFIDTEIKKKNPIVTELWDEAFVLLSAIMLLLPGILTDIMGIIGLIPPVRSRLIHYYLELNKHFHIY